MENIKKLLELYLNRKLKNQAFILILNLLILFITSIIILVLIESTAYLIPDIKIKILNLILIIIGAFFLFLFLKFIIHKYNFWNNSAKQKLAEELIDKLPTKDRIINALQIYSKIDISDSYSDLTIKAINDTSKKINYLDIKKIKFISPLKKNYILSIIIIILTSLILISNQYSNAAYRLIHYNILYEKPLPFSLSINTENNKAIFKNDILKLNIKGKGELPNKIELNWLINNKIYRQEVDKLDSLYPYVFNEINSKMKIWAQYSNKPILWYNKYIITSDTLDVILKERPEIKELNITILPPDYTKIKAIEHNPGLIKIKALEGSLINIKAITNKILKKSEIVFSNNKIIDMDIKENNISSIFQISNNIEFEINCIDTQNNYSIPIKYSIIKVDDLKPYIAINTPKNNFKIEQDYTIPISIEVIDDFGIKNVFLNYYLAKPYYLNQDTTLNKKPIFISSSENKTTEYINHDWNLSNLNLGPGDEIFYWIEAYDNNDKTGPGIGKTETLRAYYPDLEELYFEVEKEQENVIDTFEDMNESIDELKEIYEEISQDILKEEIGLEQEQEANEMIEELKEISDKIETLDETIKAIEELSQKNDLINETLGEKIEQLQQMIRESLSPELMQALQELQKNITENDFQKSMEELNNLEFEMNDLEQQLDRMLELFEQIITEQKLDELTKKIEEMSNLQKNITEKIDENSLDPNINAMINKQDNNLDDIKKTMEETESLMKKEDASISEDIKNMRNGNIPIEMKKEMNEILTNESKNKKEMAQNSTNIENNINEMMQEMNSIVSSYKKKENLEMLTKYIRIIKNLLDMSYEQELIIKKSNTIKSKKDSNISIITSKQNILVQQYKNTFIQISELAKKSFHIKPETSKAFSQIFNNFSKTISAFEQGRITTAKKHQILSMEYINKTILLLIDAMEAMQSSGSASGYAEYMEAMQELSQGQQSLNQSMMSLLPMPGQNPNSQGMMEGLMQQQQQLMQQLQKLINENPSEVGEEQGGLGKALEDMEELIKDFEQNNISQESIDRGKKVYKKLLEHQKAMKTKGTDDNWESEQGNKKEVSKNNFLFELENKNDSELKELYKTLDGLEKNEKVSQENKTIIQEYLRILIQDKLNKKNEEE